MGSGRTTAPVPRTASPSRTAPTPAAAIARLNTEYVRALHAPEVRARLEGFGLEIVGNTPEEFTVQVREDLARWAKVVEAARIKLD